MKTVLWILGLVVVGGVVWYSMSGQSSMPAANTSAAPTDPAATSASAEPTSGKMSLKDLMSLGRDQKCTFTEKTANSDSSGTVYVGGGKMRGDFTSIASGMTIQSHMIAMGQKGYLWTSAMPKQGFTFTLPDPSAPSAAPANSSAPDYNQQLDYSCSAWTVDASMFALPAGITFSDMSALMHVTPGTMPTK